MAWQNPRWNSLRGPDAENLRAIFKSLEEFLARPTFDQGIELGEEGSTPTYDPELDVVVQPTVETVDLPTIRSAGVRSVEALPPLPDAEQPLVVYLETDGKLYRQNQEGDGWTAEVQAGDMVGEIDPSQIPAEAITANHIADFAVTAKKFNTATHIIY